MKIVLTGSSGRIGSAVFAALAGQHEVVGVDRTPSSATAAVGDIADCEMMRRILAGVDAVVHVAALHAPHVGAVPDAEFARINVEATRRLAEMAAQAGAMRFVFTSTTALYGLAVPEEGCVWIDEATQPSPRTIYHQTKLEAEMALEAMAGDRFDVRILRMARCFPEPADRMAVYRLHRGIDARDVASAHCLALGNGGASFQRHVVAATPAFRPEDCDELAVNAPAVIERRAPELARSFAARGWTLPGRIDRIYASRTAGAELGFEARHGYGAVLAELDRAGPETLPPTAGMR